MIDHANGIETHYGNCFGRDLGGILRVRQGGFRDSSASLDREREALYAVIPKSQVESIVFGTGTQDDKSNAYLNANRLGLMDKILDLQRRGAFGKEAADAINEK